MTLGVITILIWAAIKADNKRKFIIKKIPFIGKENMEQNFYTEKTASPVHSIIEPDQIKSVIKTMIIVHNVKLLIKTAIYSLN